MNTKCRRVRFRIVADYPRQEGHTAYALRNKERRLMWVRINADTLAEDPRLGEDQPCKEDFKTYAEFAGKGVNDSYWKELTKFKE